MVLPAVTQLSSLRLVLEPLRVEHAAEMVEVLSDPSLYATTGGQPPTLAELRARYARQVDGPGAGDLAWSNWVLREGERPVGFVQATLRRRAGAGVCASLAWLVRPPDQGRGLAAEGAAAMVEHLRAHGVTHVAAWIADTNLASIAMARRLGLRRTDQQEDGEQLWTSDPAGS